MDKLRKKRHAISDFNPTNFIMARKGKKGMQYTTVGVIAIVAVIFGAYLANPGVFSGVGNLFAGVGSNNGGSSGVTSAEITGQVVDASTHLAISTGTTTVDFIVPPPQGSGWVGAANTATQSGGTYTSTVYFPRGTTVYVHASSTAGNRYYDGLIGPWVLGTQIPAFNAATPLWTAPQIGLNQREAAASILLSLVNTKNQAVCATATGGTGSVQTTDTAAFGSTVASSLTLYLTLSGSTASSVTQYGVPVPWLINAAGGGISQITDQLVMWIGINNSAELQPLKSAGFQQTSMALTSPAYLLWMPLPQVPASTITSQGTAQYTLPVDFTQQSIGSGKHIQYAIWISDMQNPTDAAAGLPDGAPVVHGAYSAEGVNTQVFGTTAFSVSGSRFVSPQIQCGVTQ